MFIGCPHSRFHLHIQILHHLLPNIAPSQPPYCPPVAAPIAKSSGWCETAPPRFSVAEGPPGIEKPRFWQNMVKQWQHWKCRKHYGFSKKLLTIYQIDAILIYIINYNYIYMEVSWGYPQLIQKFGFLTPHDFSESRGLSNCQGWLLNLGHMRSGRKSSHSYPLLCPYPLVI